jgi:fibronectin type 3 domain-containing protein
VRQKNTRREDADVISLGDSLMSKPLTASMVRRWFLCVPRGLRQSVAQARVRAKVAGWSAILAVLSFASAAHADTVNYVYDNAGRLYKAGFSDGKVTTYNLDAAGNRTLVTTATDTSPPTAPTSLTATAQSTSSIMLNWTASTDGTGIGVVGYRVERCAGVSCTTFVDIGSQVPGPTSFLDTSLSSDTTYRYQVKAVDGVTLKSAASNIASAKTLQIPDSSPPTAPQITQFTGVTSLHVGVTWSASTDVGSAGVALYRVERCLGSGCSSNFSVLGTVPVGTTTFDDNTTSGKTSYTYRVQAEDAQFNKSAYSANSTITTPDTLPPTVPTNFAATVVSATQINLTWTASTDQGGGTLASYRIERCFNAGCGNFTLVTNTGNTFYNDTGVVGSTTYQYRINVTDVDSNVSAWAGVITATTPVVPDTTPPSSPDASATSPNSNTVIVNWTVSTDTGGSGLANYKLWKCVGSNCGAGYTPVGTFGTTTNTYTDTAVSGSTWYHYYVTAIDNAGNVSASGAVAHIQTGDTLAPTAPSNLTATSSSSTLVTLGWTASTDTGGSGLASYRVERCSGSGCVNFTFLGNSTTASYSDSTVAGFVIYRYRVLATDVANNSSGYSNIASATPPDTIAPGAPSALAASSTSSTAVSLSWTGSSDTGGSGLAGYRIERCAGASCSNFALVTTVSGSPYTDNGVSGSTAYKYRVNAIDGSNNQSGFSNTASVTTPDTLPPTVPSNLATTVASATQINLSWGASTDQGGGTLASYRLERCSGAGCQNFALVTNTGLTTYSDTSVAGTTTYQYRVNATDVQSNISGWSNTAAATTPAVPDTTAPSAPNASATTPNSNTVIVSWSVSTDTGGSGLAGYKVWKCTGSSCPTYALLTTTAAATTTYTDTAVSGMTTYHYYVTAFDTAGNESTNGTVANITTLDTLAPTAPSALTVNSATSTGVTLSWSGSTDSGGSGLSAYRIERCAGSSCSNYSLLASVSGSPYTDSSVSGSTAYSYRVNAIDGSSNQSGYSNSVAVSTPDTIAPLPPTITSVTAVNSNRVDIAWSAGSDSGGSGLALYRIERCAGSGCGNFGEIGTTGAGAGGYTDNTTAARTWYTYRVRSQDGANNVGAPSAPVAVSVPDTLGPTVPGNFTATATSVSNVALSWQASTDVGGGSIASYRIERCVGAGCVDFALVLHTGLLSYNDTSVAGNTTYRYRIRALDVDSNFSDWTPIATATTPFVPDTAAPPSPSISGTLTPPNTITLSWSTVVDPGGSGLGGYKIWRCPQASCSAGYTLYRTVGPGVTSFTDSGLASLTWHRYYLTSFDNAGNESPQSNVVNIQTQ